MTFQLISQKIVEVEKATGDVIWGKLTERPTFNKNHSRVGARAIWAKSLHSLFSFLEMECPEPKRDKSSTKGEGSGSSFNTFGSYDEALDVFKNNPHTIRKFVEKPEEVRIPDQLGQDVFFDVAGDYLEMGRYLSGDPEHFGNMYLGNPRSVFATVMVNVTAPYFVDEAIMRRRGERILRLVDWIEAQQIRTKIIAFETNECSYTEVVVKQFQDLITLDNLAVVSHPEFLRRIVFRIAEYSETWQAGYGTSVQAMRGYMSLPTSREAGIMILSENYDSVQRVDEQFDQAELTIEKNLGEGETRFSLLS